MAQEKKEVNPYLDARRHWNDQSTGLMTQLKIWQFVGLLSLLIALTAIGGIVYFGTQNKFIPYLVKVNDLGQAVAVQPLQQRSLDEITPEIIEYQLAQFIESARMVTPDVELQRKAVLAAYNMIHKNDAANQELTQYLNASEQDNPFFRAKTEMVQVHIDAVLQQTPSTWELTWTENVLARDGSVKIAPYHMKALLTVEVTPLDQRTSEQAILQNPTGLYIKNFTWTKTQ